MSKTHRNSEVTERLRHWIDDSYGDRGRFAVLEAASGITEQRWKNVYYKRQFVTDEMLNFVQKISTESHQWITTGVETPRPKGYPFGTKPPTDSEQETLAGRLNWVIKEWAAPRGSKLFEYLESRSKDTVTAEQWAAMLLGTANPTLEMLVVVCDHRPHFTEWIVNGGKRCGLNPADSESVERWKKKQQAVVDGITSAMKKVN